MRVAVTLLFSLVMVASSFGQSASAKWQVATIMEVKAHPAAAGEVTSEEVRYDITLRVGNTEYVVLYVPPDGTLKEIVKYRLGIDGLVLVGADTIKYNDMLGTTREVPILSRRTVAAKSPKKELENKQ